MSVFEHRVILPYAYRRRGATRALHAAIDLSRYDVVIVRNLFSVLRNVLSARGRYAYKVGFWESFPHSYRRIYEARLTGKSVFRKTIEYAIRKRLEHRLIAGCDFYLPITETFKQLFRGGLTIPYHALPMGVDFSHLPAEAGHQRVTGPIKFVYTGTIDRLRQVDLLVTAFTRQRGDFQFDLYTPSDNEVVAWIKAIGDPRINVRPAQPRDTLYRTLLHYDVGIGTIPDTLLYRVSSPTKTLEYYALGIPSLINHLPEYDSLFDDTCAFFCSPTEDSIGQAIKRMLDTDRETMGRMGKRGTSIVKQTRDYAIMARNLSEFITATLLNKT